MNTLSFCSLLLVFLGYFHTGSSRDSYDELNRNRVQVNRIQSTSAAKTAEQSLLLIEPKNVKTGAVAAQPTFDDSFYQQAKATYKRIIPCLMNCHHIKDPRLMHNLKPPIDVKEHYLDLLEKTKGFRGLPVHSYNHFKGPWIENHFINHFIDKPFEYFNGLVPLFIQWVDIHAAEFMQSSSVDHKEVVMPNLTTVVHSLMHWLRRDVIYLAVSQDDQGISPLLTVTFPNILIMSAGGYGHIPIPLIKGELSYAKPSEDGYKVDVGFYGDKRIGFSRNYMLMEVEPLLKMANMSYRYAQNSSWISLMKETKFNLAPRGFGRTSFRLAEVIQSGRVPVYVYDDIRWIPYEGSNISIETYGYVARVGQMKQLVGELKSTSDAKYSEKLAAVKRVRHYFTYEGVVQQIDAFIRFSVFNSTTAAATTTRSASGGGGRGKSSIDYNEAQRAAGVYLRCQRVPERDHR